MTDISTNNLHRVFKNNNDGFFHKLIPSMEQLDAFKYCKDKVQEKLESDLKEIYGVKPKFRLQGSWAYGTCNVPALATQEMDFDYGCYLPNVCFVDDEKTEGEKILRYVEKSLQVVCDEQDWTLDTSNASCLRITGFLPQAHFDVPLYAVPDDMFADLQDVQIRTQKSETIANESMGLDSAILSFDFSEKNGDTRPDSLSAYFGESQFSNEIAFTTLSNEARQGRYELGLDSINEKNSIPKTVKKANNQKIQNIRLIKRDEDWKTSDCEKVREWFVGTCDKYPNEGQQLRAIVRYVKSWRDFLTPQFKKAPSSIALMVLTTQSYEHLQQRDDKALNEVIKNLPNGLVKSIKCKDIVGHESEDFNNLNEEERERAKSLATQFSQVLDECLFKHTSAIDCLEDLKTQFGYRIPRQPELVAINVKNETKSIFIESQPLASVATPAIIKTQFGG
ncbi:CBASS cGAMP synthase [Moraxella atlantae]|uniref:Cyclic GMP-AMP synthase n=1 Tax=Faucicola atlantae TaxID=34059 RepID=A0A378QMH2_9GAMM|nr:hypothetical protein [Moraxella atlantae]OPH35645.1 hypothetical protein B5J92_04780 [Moraxella atlantae]STZ01630.1 Uncharacterised protein [Moraxella atlantae]